MSVIKDIAYVKRVCKPNTHQCCSYLGAGAGGMECLKEDVSFKPIIDERRAAGTMNAKGDNCDGYEAELIKQN